MIKKVKKVRTPKRKMFLGAVFHQIRVAALGPADPELLNLVNKALNS